MIVPLLALVDKKEHRKTGNWLSCQVAKLVHSTNETNIQRARFDKKEEWREREREREQLENNSEQILDNLWITAFFYIVNLLHFIVSLLKINMDEKKRKKIFERSSMLSISFLCFLRNLLWFCSVYGFKNLFVVYFFRLILLFLGCSHAWKSIFPFLFR